MCRIGLVAEPSSRAGLDPNRIQIVRKKIVQIVLGGPGPVNLICYYPLSG